MLKQIAVFMENRPGRMKEALEVLAKCHVDINGLSVADTADFGVLRMILSDPALGEKALKEQGFIVKATEVLAIDIADTPGELCHALSLLSEQEINVEYMYAFGTKLSGHAMIIVKTNDNRLASEILQKASISVLSLDMVRQRLISKG